MTMDEMLANQALHTWITRRGDNRVTNVEKCAFLAGYMFRACAKKCCGKKCSKSTVDHESQA